MNTVNPSNFNETMDGYVSRAWEETLNIVEEKGLSMDEAYKIKRIFQSQLSYAKSVMTMEEARNKND
jgi:hypothetical protein